MCIVICTLLLSRPARGAWVEMQILIVKPSLENRRAPQGARGLKFSLSSRVQPLPRSRPARGAWVEISMRQSEQKSYMSRPARGAWVEILRSLPGGGSFYGRAPQGARGLKSSAYVNTRRLAPSRPARGAWVEIFILLPPLAISFWSRPARGAWVEITRAVKSSTPVSVAPRKGRVG